MLNDSRTSTFSFSFSELTSLLRTTTNLDFCIIFNNKEYFINKLMACTLSNKIYSYCLSDCLFSQIIINSNNGPFEIIQNFLLGNPFHTSSDNYYFCLKMAVILEIDSLFKIILNDLTEFDLQQISNLFFLAFENHSDVSSFLPIIIRNFLEIYNSQSMNSWSADLFDNIFRFRKPNASLLIPIVEKFLAQNSNTRLLKYYSLSPELLTARTTNINFFRNLLLYYHPVNKINLSKIEFNETDKFAGILNTRIRPKIFISTSETKFRSISSKLLLKDENFLYNELDIGINHIIEFSFPAKEKTVNLYLAGYVIKTWEKASSKITPIHWRIEVSHNRKHWITIDERFNQIEMLNNNSTYYYPVRDEDVKCSFIRFVQIKNGTSSNNDLAISRFDVFGKYNILS